MRCDRDGVAGVHRAQRAMCAALVMALACLSCGDDVHADRPPSLHTPAPATPVQGATLIWSDEFDGPAGLPPNRGKWNLETGDGGWGNNEMQTYTESRENSYLDGHGNLVIVARKDRNYTSARLNTLGKYAIQDGVLSARIRVPAGQGLLPAFWLLGTDMADVGWPRSGEIDVIETPNTGRQYNNGIHGPMALTGEPWKSSTDGTIDGVDLADDFHVYSMAKAADAIAMSIDGVPVGSYTRAQLDPDQQWVFDKPSYVLFSLAVGGDWPGPPDGTTPDPARLYIDWVRAYTLR